MEQIMWRKQAKISKAYYALKLLVVGTVLVLTAIKIMKKEKANA